MNDYYIPSIFEMIKSYKELHRVLLLEFDSYDKERYGHDYYSNHQECEICDFKFRQLTNINLDKK